MKVKLEKMLEAGARASYQDRPQHQQSTVRPRLPLPLLLQPLVPQPLLPQLLQLLLPLPRQQNPHRLIVQHVQTSKAE